MGGIRNDGLSMRPCRVKRRSNPHHEASLRGGTIKQSLPPKRHCEEERRSNPLVLLNYYLAIIRGLLHPAIGNLIHLPGGCVTNWI